jgi:hypothetical protein
MSFLVGYRRPLLYHCTRTAADLGVPRQVRILLLVTLWLAYVLARLSLDTVQRVTPAPRYRPCVAVL